MYNGIGVYQWPNGTSYEGQWLNDQMHGRGIQTFQDSTIYEGEFLNNKAEGVGQFKF